MASYAVLKRGVDEAVLNQNGTFHPMVVTDNISGSASTSNATIATIVLPADSGYIYKLVASDLNTASQTVTWDFHEGAILVQSAGYAAGTGANNLEVYIHPDGTARTILLRADSDAGTPTVTAEVTVFRYFIQAEADTGISIS